MVPVLKSFITAVVVLILFASPPAVCFAHSSAKHQLHRISEAVDSSQPALDDEARELLASGKPGFLIETVRFEVLSLLSESNSCSAWFLSAEPSAREKFRSLHFALDLRGAGEIVKVEGGGAASGFYHPYVASTRQNVGAGSTITVNANGAFFRTSALVREPDHPADRISASSYRSLSVGNYGGSSPEAQLLTVLHEFGHIVDLLPVDAGVPSAPFISIRNTETVLHHCRSGIQAHSKHLRLIQNSAWTLPIGVAYSMNSASPNLAVATQRRSFRGEPSYRNDGW